MVVSGTSERIVFLSATYPGKVNDKRIADEAELEYPPGTVLYKDAGFQGYEPSVAQTRQAKKKAAGSRADRSGETGQPQAGAGARAGGTRDQRREAQPGGQGRAPQSKARDSRLDHRGRLRAS